MVTTEEGNLVARKVTEKIIDDCLPDEISKEEIAAFLVGVTGVFLAVAGAIPETREAILVGLQAVSKDIRDLD